MCNRCGRCGNDWNDERFEDRRCIRETRALRELMCAAEHFAREDRERRCCERRCECEFKRCVRRCNNWED